MVQSIFFQTLSALVHSEAILAGPLTLNRFAIITLASDEARNLIEIFRSF